MKLSCTAIILAAAVIAACSILPACGADRSGADRSAASVASSSESSVEPSAPVSASPSSESGSEIAGFPPDKPDRAGEILAAMSRDEKIGQLFLAHFNAGTAEEKAAKYGFGGYILFAGDFDAVSRTDMEAKLQAVQDASKIDMLLGVDEEGGYINRVSSNTQYRSEPFPSAQWLYANGGWDAIIQDTHEKSTLLKSVGLNLNLAPVCDVSLNRADYIHYRTLGMDAETTARYAGLVAAAMSEEKIGSVLKHFPGYGNNRDTHDGMAYDSRDYDMFLNGDFLPFIEGIKAGADCVLVSHNVVACMDADAPASLSPEVHRILREDLGFDGVIMTDDLNMGAVSRFTGGKGAAVTALLAGNDLLCCADSETEFEYVKAAVADGTITAERLDESVLRILNWKLDLGIVE